MAYKISAACVACGACAGICPAAAIVAAGGKFSIDPALCVDCGGCVAACPMGAIARDADIAAGKAAGNGAGRA